MTKKIMAVVLAVLMLVLGGVRLKADHCGSSRIVGRRVFCEGRNCAKWGVDSPNYMEEIERGRDCWNSSGKYYYEHDGFEVNKLGCC